MNTSKTAKSKTKTMFDPRRSFLVGMDAFRATRAGEEAIKARQRRRFSNLLRFCRERSPYYRNLYKNLPHDALDLSLLPPTDKQTLMENFDEWVTDPEVTREGVEAHLADRALIGKPYLGRYLVWTSSGTSGVPVALVADKGTLAVMAVMGVLRGPARPREMLEILLRGGRQAGLYGAGGHMHGTTMMEHMRDHPGRRERFVGFSLLTPLPELVRRLNDFRPAMFWAFASTLTLLAEEQEAGRLKIDPVLILSGGEALTAGARRRMEAAFGCPVRDYYGAAEAAGLAHDCAHGRLHVNADWFVLEPVDEDHRPVPPGEVSHTVLLSNLANRVQPLLRYDLGDRVSLTGERCPCGSALPVLWVEGRRNELLSFGGDGGGEVRLPPRALSMVVDSTPGVRRCQVIKTSPDALKVRIETTGDADRERTFEEALGRVRRYLSDQDLSRVSVERDPERPAIDKETGKFRHVWSEAEKVGGATW